MIKLYIIGKIARYTEFYMFIPAMYLKSKTNGCKEYINQSNLIPQAHKLFYVKWVRMSQALRFAYQDDIL